MCEWLCFILTTPKLINHHTPIYTAVFVSMGLEYKETPLKGLYEVLPVFTVVSSR